MQAPDDFPLSDTVSFETADGWFDLLLTTAWIPGEPGGSGPGVFRTVADLHAPHSHQGDATLLQGLMRDYPDAAAARAGHAVLLDAVERRTVELPIPAAVRAIRKL